MRLAQKESFKLLKRDSISQFEVFTGAYNLSLKFSVLYGALTYNPSLEFSVFMEHLQSQFGVFSFYGTLIFLVSRYNDIYFLVSRYNNSGHFFGLCGIFQCRGITIIGAFGIFTAFLESFPHETTVTPNLQHISAGLNFKPAENSTGRLFGHDLFSDIPRLGMARGSLEMMRRGRMGRRRSKHGQVRFSPFSRICRFQPRKIQTVFS